MVGCIILVNTIKVVKEIKSKVIFVFLNICELLVLLLSLTIYTSPFKIFSWYEPDSIEFAGILLISPLYLFIGAALLGLSAFITISLTNKILPFLSYGLIIPIFLFDHFPYQFYQIVYGGIVFICLLFFSVIFSTISNLVKFKELNMNQ